VIKLKQKSLKRELNHWITFTALAFVLIGGAIAGRVAFNQARELQDHTLLEIAKLIKAGKLKESRLLHHDIDIETIIINELGEKQHVPVIPLDISDGFHTKEFDGNNWRVFITTQPDTQRRFSVAQQTRLRDDIAMSSSLAVLLPLVLLVGLMSLIIHFIIKRQFNSLSQLAQAIDNQDGTNPQTLRNRDIPVEITPFVNSINSLLSRVRQSMQKQQRFIADAAHELRTPITALSLQLENLDQAQSQSDRAKHQQQLQFSLTRLGRLVSQLLDLARLQNEEIQAREVILLNKIVQETIAALYPLAEAANIDLGMIRQENNIYVYDYQGRIGQLIYNAIDNAIHYSPKGGTVDISLFTQNGNAIFLVEDTGIGIPEDELEQVMQPFHRINESNQPGNGLGLAISHEIAQHLGGTITLKNRPSGGLVYQYKQKAISKTSIHHKRSRAAIRNH